MWARREGTGIVHIAPGCGAEDFELSRSQDCPCWCRSTRPATTWRATGRLSGHNALNVRRHGVRQPGREGLRLPTSRTTRTATRSAGAAHTDLVFRVVTEWFISADEIRPRMKAAAAKVKWYPDEAGKRMQDWLYNMRDWCISRKRYWGLPLPFYVCEECGEFNQRRLAGRVDAPWPSTRRWWTPCPNCTGPGSTRSRCTAQKCNAIVERIPEVGDCWLDAGIVAFSTLGYLGDGPGRAILGRVVPRRLGQRDARADPALVLRHALHVGDARGHGALPAGAGLREGA